MISHGGSAFPTSQYLEGVQGYDGMTLRDYFAAKAMAALVADINDVPRLARDAYIFADEMLKARKL